MKVLRNFFGYLGISLIQQSKKADLDNFFSLIRDNSHNVPLKRYGPNGDGGYLIPEQTPEIKTCFSPGVADSVEFEKMLFTKKKSKIILLDGSIEQPSKEIEKSVFEKAFLGPYNTKTHLNIYFRSIR